MDNTVDERRARHDLIAEACADQNIKLEVLSRGWLRKLQKGHKTRYALGYSFELNPQSTSMIANDKFATYEALRTAGLPIIQHEILYDFDNHAPYAEGHNSLGFVKEYLAKHNNHIVIKPNDGKCGKNVFQIRTESEIIPALAQVFKTSESASLCPFYEIAYEYRVVLLDDEPRLIYAKTSQGDWRFNLSQGAKATKVTDQNLQNLLAELARKATQALNLRFCSVDIIRTIQNEWLIIEINSGVMIAHYAEQHPEDYGVVKQIYADAIKRMFEQ